uniref:Methyltransferase HEMK2 n=1 Tax=Lutzomyia longipalpis TaxID=7200 RepID=A0A1B0CPT4_LUTLO
MDRDDSESTTSLEEENTENFCDNPTRDTLAEGLMGLFKPAIDQLDDKVRTTRVSQLELKEQLDRLHEELKKIQESQKTPPELDAYVKKLINVKHKVTVVTNVLQGAQDRLNRLHQQFVYEAAEDSFLLLDALEEDLIQIRAQKPILCVEIGSGSGVIITALAKSLSSSAHCIAIDINQHACKATKRTSQANGATVDVIAMDLLSSFRANSIDLLIFNPPYVPTEENEADSEDQATFAGCLAKSWAGGVDGCATVRRLLPSLGEKLSQSAAFYLLLLRENKPREMLKTFHEMGFTGSIVKERRIRGEYLYILKIKARMFEMCVKMSKVRGTKKGGKKDGAETCEVFTRAKGETRICFLDKTLLEVKEGCESNGLDVITLKNPSSLKGSNYIVSADGKLIRELLQFCQPHRCWFVDESIEADGNIYMTTPIDPLFLILPYLVDACSEMASPMDSFLVDQDFPDIFRLQKILTEKQLLRVADQKGKGVVKGFKYNETKTMDWLSQKCHKVAKVLKEKKIFVGQGAVSATFVSPDAVDETEDEMNYLTYAFTIVSDYISQDLSSSLKTKLGIEDKVTASSVKRKSSKTLQDTAAGKKSKTDIKDSKENVFADSDLAPQEKTPEVKLSTKDKARAKAASGTKNIMSFFKKK